MFVLMISRSSLKLGHLISETSSPGQIKGKPCSCSRGHIFEVIIMNLAQNVCLDDFKVMYSFLSSDSLKFFHLGQFLSNYWSYRVIFGTCEVFVFRSVSQYLLPGLPLTSRLRKSQTSYSSNLEVLQENVGSPTFFRATVVCPFFSRI